jgi:hypothetical protein
MAAVVRLSTCSARSSSVSRRLVMGLSASATYMRRDNTCDGLG